MALLTTRASVENSQEQAEGSVNDGLPIKSFRYLDMLSSVAPEQLIAGPQPGFYPISEAPLKERDCVVNEQYVERHSAAEAASVQLIRDEAILQGFPHYLSTGAADEGLSIKLPADVTTFSRAIMFNLTSLTGNSGLADIGFDLDNRSFTYVTNDGRLANSSGSGDSDTTAPGLITAATWYTLVETFDLASQAYTAYLDAAASPVLAATKDAGQPAHDVAHLFIAGNSGNEGAGRMAFHRLWNKVLDGPEINVIMAAGAGLKGLQGA